MNIYFLNKKKCSKIRNIFSQDVLRKQIILLFIHRHLEVLESIKIFEKNIFTENRACIVGSFIKNDKGYDYYR